MSETLENEAITQAIEIIDGALGALHQRELMSAGEVLDLLLDMRSALTPPEIQIEELQKLEELDELEPSAN